jgi:hypothetical protein
MQGISVSFKENVQAWYRSIHFIFSEHLTLEFIILTIVMMKSAPGLIILLKTKSSENIYSIRCKLDVLFLIISKGQYINVNSASNPKCCDVIRWRKHQNSSTRAVQCSQESVRCSRCYLYIKIGKS